MSKAMKISEINITIFDDGKCIVKNNILHKIEDAGTVKQIVPKKELLEFLNIMVPAVDIHKILNDIEETTPVPIVMY